MQGNLGCEGRGRSGNVASWNGYFQLMINQPFRVWLTNWQTKICLLFVCLGDCDYHDYAGRWWSKGWRTRTTHTGPGLGKTNWEWTPWSWSGGERFLARPNFAFSLSHFPLLQASRQSQVARRLHEGSHQSDQLNYSILRLKNKYFLCQSHNVFDENKLPIVCKPFFLKNDNCRGIGTIMVQKIVVYLLFYVFLISDNAHKNFTANLLSWASLWIYWHLKIAQGPTFFQWKF